MHAMNMGYGGFPLLVVDFVDICSIIPVFANLCCLVTV